jgi:uncharacterized membrane protein
MKNLIKITAWITAYAALAIVIPILYYINTLSTYEIVTNYDTKFTPSSETTVKYLKAFLLTNISSVLFWIATTYTILDRIKWKSTNRKKFLITAIVAVIATMWVVTTCNKELKIITRGNSTQFLDY